MDLEKYAKSKGEQINTVRKEMAMAIFTGVVQRTPVDTGRARGNWQISVGTDNTSEIDRKDKGVYGSPAQYASEEANKLSDVKGDESIYISNNLPYINALEYGHSQKQAPNGMVGITVANMQKYIKDAVDKSGWNK